MFGAGERAQVTGNAESLVGIWVNVESRCAAITFRNLRSLERILFGINLLGMLIAEGHTKALHQVHEKDFSENLRHSHNVHSIPRAAGA